MEDPNHTMHLSSRSVRSDVYYPPGQDDKEKTGSYVINADPEYENTKQRRTTQTSGSSGEYDFPDPNPEGGQRTTYYDNPGLQKVRMGLNNKFSRDNNSFTLRVSYPDMWCCS